MAEKSKAGGFLPKNMKENLADSIELLLDAADDQKATVEQIPTWTEDDEEQVLEAVGYVRACADLHGASTNLVKYIVDFAVDHGIRKPDQIRREEK
jgi:hypothetical protein